MDYLSLTPAEQAVLRDTALRRAHELRRQAIADAWATLFAALRRPAAAGPRKAVTRATPSLR